MHRSNKLRWQLFPPETQLLGLNVNNIRASWEVLFKAGVVNDYINITNVHVSSVLLTAR